MGWRVFIRPVVVGSTPTPAIMADEITDAIETNATGPKKASADGVTMEQHSLADQIAADKHVGAKAATSGSSPRLMINLMVPPGAV